ncbi:MAG: AraC family transcriptional regulator [Oscillospiraceae bacterium]|nr:AraC family transcriptional regulator [Oscillospiraceae bacterium]
MSVTEKAMQCAFSSPSYFSSVFKKIIDTTQLKFRSEKKPARSVRYEKTTG